MLDELRLGGALAAVGDIHAPAPFDKSTSAVWRFDEGNGAAFYPDGSRARLTLRRGYLPVTPKGALTTTWARMKQ